MTRSRMIPLASLAVTSLLFAACGGDDDAADTTDATATTEVSDSTDAPATTGAPDTTEVPDTTDAAASTVADTTEAPATTEASAPDTTTGETPATEEPTAPGTELAYGEPAVVALDEEAPEQLLQLVAQAPAEGTPAELDELQVEDVPSGSTLHYVTLDITNISAEPVGGEYLPNTTFQLLVLQDDGQPAQPIINFVAFEPCDEEDPDDLAVGESFTTCLTYLAAPDTTITGISYAPTFSDDPIAWS